MNTCNNRPTTFLWLRQFLQCETRWLKVQHCTTEQFSVRIGEKIVDVFVPQVQLKESFEVVVLFPQVRVQRQTNEHTEDTPALHILKEIVEVRGWSYKNVRNDIAMSNLWMCLVDVPVPPVDA